MASTSTSAQLGSTEVLAEIKKLFSWNPPHLKSKKKTTHTCPASFYDKHFSEKLVLQKVELLPSLVEDLRKNVDEALEAALNTLPSLGGFITAEQRDDDNSSSNKLIRDEKEVASCYEKTTARYCTRVASTLALHPTASFSRWKSLLFWTQSDTFSDYVIADGQLCFLAEDEDTKDREAIVESMASGIRPFFDEMRKAGSPLATWQMKSLSTGPFEVIAAVRNLGKFSWKYCDEFNCAEANKCDKARMQVKKANVGPDAQAPPWKLPDRSSSLNTEEELNITPDTGSSKHAQASSSKIKGKKRKRDDDDEEEEARHRPITRSQARAALSSKCASPRKDKGKKREDDTNDTDDRAYQDTHDKTAKKLVQQAWAQAVKVDGTLIVLYSGNYELVCIRHRASRTLYVSKIIQPPTEPEYGKLHIGIYIAAIQETMDRRKHKQVLKSEPSGDGGDEDDQDEDDQDHNGGSRDWHGRHHDKDCGGRHGRGGRHAGRGVGRSQFEEGSAGRSSPTDELVSIEKMIDVVNMYNVVLLYLQYDIYDSPIPATFVRYPPSSITNPHKRSGTQFSPQAITIILTSEIGFGATGKVHGGTLWDGAMSLDIAVKLAFNEQRDSLRNEYEIYCHLRTKGVEGITTALGLFDDVEDGACALVMIYAGVPLTTESKGHLSNSGCESALSTLKSIHGAGILHGDIRPENILISNSGITIIDFGHSKRSTNQKAKDEELSILSYLLGLAGKE